MRERATSTRTRFLRGRLRLRVELAPAREALGQQPLDCLGAVPIRLDALDVLPVIAGGAHPLAQIVLLALERFELGGQRIELALLVPRKAHALLRRALARSDRFPREGAIGRANGRRPALREPVRI